MGVSDTSTITREVKRSIGEGDAVALYGELAPYTACPILSLLLFKGLPDDAWDRRGHASGCEFSVRSMAWITAGHTQHHFGILRERYF